MRWIVDIIIGVKNFGKIESAEINVGNYAVFVGCNNSGKTYMMQLIYGVLDEILQMNSYGNFMDDFTDLTYQVDDKFVAKLQKNINSYLKREKAAIIKRIFHKEIPIEELWIQLGALDHDYRVKFRIADSVLDQNKVINDILWAELEKDNLLINAVGLLREGKSVGGDVITPAIVAPAVRVIVEALLGGLSRKSAGKRFLYLPASRTGIQLLYKYFFSEKDKVQSGVVYFDDMEKISPANELGLTTPVYDFLQFLLRYSPNEEATEYYKEQLIFIETHLLDGRLMQDGEETYYLPQENDIKVPLYLSSSMVNELTPIVKALTGKNRYRYLFYDEVETCLHPSKQMEMARLLNRLNNQGIRLVISTHSDTMATQINNLLMLSRGDMIEEQLNKRLEQLNMERDDLLKSKEVHVYQFIIDEETGKSRAEELEFTTTPYVGYQFTQFMDNAMRLYEESKTIMGIDADEDNNTAV